MAPKGGHFIDFHLVKSTISYKVQGHLDVPHSHDVSYYGLFATFLIFIMLLLCFYAVTPLPAGYKFGQILTQGYKQILTAAF